MHFMNFQVFGEVVETLLVSHPDRRLLVDIVVDTSGMDVDQGLRPTRTCFSILEDDLIEVFKKTVSVGDLLRAEGTFSQSNYIPHKTSYIDTTFRMQTFRKIERDVSQIRHNGHVFDAPQTPVLH